MKVDYIDCMVCGNEINVKIIDFGENIKCAGCGSVLIFYIETEVVEEKD